MKQKINLTDTGKLNIHGERIFSADAGPYKYVTCGEDFDATGKLVECVMWCSRDGECNSAVDATKYDIEDITKKGELK